MLKICQWYISWWLRRHHADTIEIVCNHNDSYMRKRDLNREMEEHRIIDGLLNHGLNEKLKAVSGYEIEEIIMKFAEGYGFVKK